MAICGPKLRQLPVVTDPATKTSHACPHRPRKLDQTSQSQLKVLVLPPASPSLPSNSLPSNGLPHDGLPESDRSNAELPDPSLPKVSLPNPNLFRRFWRGYIHKHTLGILACLLLMIVEGSALGALSYLLKPLFDVVFTPGGEAALYGVGFAIFGLFAARAFTVVISRTLIWSISQRVSAAMQSDLLRHILTLDAPFFQTNPPGVLIERVQGDTNAVQGIWSTLVTGVGRDLLGLVVLLAVAVSIDPQWTLAALIGAPLLILPASLLQRYVRRKSKELRNQAGQRATRLDEIFHGITAVKLNRMEDYQTKRFRAVLTSIRRAEVRSVFGRSLMPGMIDLVTGLGFFAVLLMSGNEISSGQRTTGDFMSFFTAMSLTFQPLRRLGEMAGTWQIAAASLERIYALFDARPAYPRPVVSIAVPAPGAPEIRFEDVNFAHGDQPVLRGLSFTAEAGRTTALVGSSGAGKSTVFHLLTGLLEPGSGVIWIGGVAASGLSLADQRGLFATVTQDSALFDETLAENIALGRNIAPAALDAALHAAHVADFLPALPNGLQTPVGPRGSALSGGQRQRVAIARALVQDAPVLLLDEATSALDAQSESIVAEALAMGSQGRTTLVIAHRLATVRDADKIVVIDKGRVVETGTHDQLLTLGGVYAGLYRLQFKD
ncbi:MAG: transporter related [Cypionkella sp.]|nr:transporter related [Cypionkella sp.]